jgi:hypothetical protein
MIGLTHVMKTLPRRRIRSELAELLPSLAPMISIATTLARRRGSGTNSGAGPSCLSLLIGGSPKATAAAQDLTTNSDHSDTRPAPIRPDKRPVDLPGERLHATTWTRLTSEGSLVRTQLRPPDQRHITHPGCSPGSQFLADIAASGSVVLLVRLAVEPSDM